MFLPQLDYFCMADRMFFLFGIMLPITAFVVLVGLVIEYNIEMRKRKNRKRR